MFLEFVKDEATAAEAKLKLHLSPAHIISSAAGEKINKSLTPEIFVWCFLLLGFLLVLLCGFSMSQLKLWSCSYIFNPFFVHGNGLHFFFQLIRTCFILYKERDAFNCRTVLNMWHYHNRLISPLYSKI